MRNFIIVLLLAGAIVICGAYFLGLFTISAEREDGRFTTSLTINTASLQQAADSAKAKAKKLGQSVSEEIGDLKGTETAMGNVTAVDSYGQSFTLSTSDERELSIRMDPTTKVTGSQLRGIHVGDRVTVVFETKDGQHVARSITAE